MTTTFIGRIVVLILVLWWPFQDIATNSVSLCEAGIGNGASDMSASNMKTPCGHVPAMCNGAIECKLRPSCSLCFAFPVGDANRPVAFRPAPVLGLRVPWSVVTFVTTPPEHPPQTDVLQV
jgi:hypothetical protein